MIGERTAEEIKIKIGSAYQLEQELAMEIRGRDLINGLPKTVKITSEEIREALSEPVGAIVEAVKAVLEKTPPGTRRRHHRSRHHPHRRRRAACAVSISCSRRSPGVPAIVADDPLSCVALGTGARMRV